MSDRGMTTAPKVPAPPAESAPSWRDAFAALRHHHFRILWFAFIATFMGLQMQLIANIWLAFDLTDSLGKAALVGLAWGTPMFSLTLVGGAIADRVDRRAFTLYTQAANGAVAAVTVVLVMTDTITLWQLLMVSVVHGSLFALNMPGRQAQVADVVPKEDLENGVALAMAAQNSMRIVGPAVAAVGIGLLGVEWVYALIAVMYVATIGLQVILPRSRPAGSRQVTLGIAAAVRSVLSEIGDGAGYVARDRELRLLMLMAFVPLALGMPFLILLVGFVKEDLGLGDGGYGTLVSVNGAGAVVGSLIVAALTKSSRKPLLQLLMILGSGAGLVLLGAGSAAYGIPAALVALAIIGLALTGYQVLNNTMIMGATEPAYYGRVMSIVLMTNSLMPMMALPLGLVADRVGATTVFTAEGVLIFGFLALVLLARPRYAFTRTPVRSTDGSERTPAEAAAEPAS